MKRHGAIDSETFFWIVITIVLVLAGVYVLYPAQQGGGSASPPSTRMQCSNHIKQIAIAMNNYHDTLTKLPPAYTVDAEGRPLHSWRVLILPYIEQQELYERIRLDEPWDSPYNRQFHNVDIPQYRCPADQSRPGECSYSVVLGPDTPFTGPEQLELADIVDGNSNTIMIVERATPLACWMDPGKEITQAEAGKGINVSPNGIGSSHGTRPNSGAQVGLCDGSVRFLSERTDTVTLQSALNRKEGNPVVF